MKHVLVYALLMFVYSTFCEGQTKIDWLKGTSRFDTKETITSFGPKTITRNILQDRKGNIWFTSWEGVFRYDGRNLTNMTSDVSSARFFSILEDSKGNLWLGSIGSGVYCYDGKSFQNFTTKDGLPNNEIVCIYEDKAGTIWFGANGGASRYDGKSFRNYTIKGDSMNEDRTGISFPDFKRPGNEVNSIIEDKTGKFWLGTRDKTFVYDGKTFTLVAHTSKPFTNVRSILEDNKGTIWLGGQDGLWRYDGTTFTNITENFVGYIYEDKQDNIWTSSETAQGWVLSRYDVKSLSNNKPAVTELNPQEGKMLFGILEDKDGHIWFGADGAYRYNGNTITNLIR
jgi:ligand-binding sensor domain-containing protein